MEKIIYGTIVIKDKEYPFLLEGRIVKIVTHSAIFMPDFQNETVIESIQGITHDNRDIMFLKCEFIKSFWGRPNKFTIDGYILSMNNCKEYSFQIDSLAFYSDAINMFYPPQQARTINDWRDTSKDRQITFLPTNETGCSFEFNGDKYSFSIGYSVNLRYGSKGLGEISSKIEIAFERPIAPITTIDYVRKIYDFLVFVNYSSNIRFDDIYIHQRNKEGLYEKCATLNFFQNTGNYENNELTSLTIDDIDKDKLAQLFKVATSVRCGKNKMQLYYPDNKKDRRQIEPIKWLTKALAFEGLFEETFPEHKAKENPSFSKIKKNILDSISTVQGESKKERKYCDDFKNHIERYDGILEEKFNFAQKRYEKYINNILQDNLQSYNVPTDTNYGNIYMKYRNNVAHGNVIPLSDEEIAVYRIMETMIYLMLLEDVNLSEEELHTVVKKLFD